MERKVLKRRIKGLAAFVLAVVMMFGSSISALAADYWFTPGCDNSPQSTTTMNEGDVLTKEDGIGSDATGNRLLWRIDNGGFEEFVIGDSGSYLSFEFIPEGAEYEVTEVTCGNYNEGTEYKMWITLVPYGEGGSGNTGGEEGGSTGESGGGSTGGEEGGSTEDTGSFESTEDTKVEDKDTKKKDAEKKPEEPKESEEQIFNRELLESAAAAKAGDNVTIDATLWHSFSSDVLKELLSKGGVSYTLYYNYEGECFYITLPAGAVLEEGCEWYGPLKLNAMFGRTMIDKKDLHAAING